MQTFVRLFSRISLLLGLVFLLLSFALIFQRYNPNRAAFAAVPEKTEQYQQVSPLQSISIPSITVNLLVESVTVENNKWPLSNTGVSYLSSSAIPGQKGNSIFYGHNWSSLLGDLDKVKPGEIISVRFANGQSIHYSIAYTYEVSPEDTSILAQTEDKTLTIYTCSGFLDRKRFVVVAKAI